MRLQASQRYRKKVEARQALEERRLAYSNIPRDEEDVEDVFHTITQSDIDTSRARTASRAKAKKWCHNLYSSSWKTNEGVAAEHNRWPWTCHAHAGFNRCSQRSQQHILFHSLYPYSSSQPLMVLFFLESRFSDDL